MSARVPDRSTQPPDPSALLAEVAARLCRWERRGFGDADWLDRAEARLVAAARRCVDAEPSLEMRLARARIALRDEVKPTFEGFCKLAEALQRLDDWHRPLGWLTNRDVELDLAQDAAQMRLVVGGGGYNASKSFGTVIPARSDVGATSAVRTGVVAQLLHWTAYLPRLVAAGDPDDAKAASDRMVELRYVARSTRSNDPRGDVGDRPVVAVAPVLQDRADAIVEHRRSPDRYGVRVLYDHRRLDDLVAAAVEGGAHLLFMPEMAVDAEQVRALASAVRRAVGGWRRSKGTPSQLRFVVAGLAHASGETGDNSVIVLDAEGRVVFRQEKLCRWNLRWYHQRNYGVVPSCSTGAPDLVEDIPGGRHVYVADLAGLGRFLTLICADMDHDKPGDWLVSNLAVDWLHAPIMDKSIAWQRDPSGRLEPWIVERAHRAVENGVTKVVVTNSVLLTLLLNDHNGANPHLGFPVLDRCAIAFMLDGDSRTFLQVEARVPCAAPIVETVRWLDGFQPFPPP